VVFWVVTPCSAVVGYQRFEGPYCLRLQVVTLCSAVVGYQRFEGPYCLYLHAADGGSMAHDILTHKTRTWIQNRFTEPWHCGWRSRHTFKGTEKHCSCITYLVTLLTCG